jgi:hypothetical protein
MPNTRKQMIYWNDKQLAFLQAKQRFRTFLAGRATGKSTVIAGINYLRMTNMPRAKFFLSSTTYNQILTKTLPAIESKWQEMGLVENEDYVVGVRPPKDWQSPYQPPRKFQNVISFENGFCIEMLSLDRPDLARGGSYQGGDIDEAALVQKEHYTKVLLPSVRGMLHKFPDTHLYGNINKYTSIPWKPSGYWILEDEEKAGVMPDKYLFLESNAYDNIQVLGPQFIKDLEMELPYLEFQVEILNRRIKMATDAFYHKLNIEKHVYATQYLYVEGNRGIETKAINDINYNPNEILDVSFDFSGWFNCATTWQERKMVEYCLQEFYVKQDEGKVKELVDKICKRYEHHQYKQVRLWGEPRGNDKNATDMDNIYQQIAKRFKDNGWNAEIKAHAGRTTNHKERHFFMNNVLDEGNNMLPKLRFNEEGTKNVLIAMQVCNIINDFQKDKSAEKKRDYPQEHAPHFTDTVDYYVEQKHRWRETSHGNRRAMSATVR